MTACRHCGLSGRDHHAAFDAIWCRPSMWSGPWPPSQAADYIGRPTLVSLEQHSRRFEARASSGVQS